MSQDALNPQQFHYHVTDPRNRESIQEHGLKASKSIVGKNRVYLATTPLLYGHEGKDVWKVNTKGADIKPDDDTPTPHSFYANQDFGPHQIERIEFNAKRPWRM